MRPARILSTFLTLALLGGCVVEATGESATVVPDEGCELDFCEHEGWCSNIDGECVATTAAECEQSRVCRYDGRCALSKGQCVQ